MIKAINNTVATGKFSSEVPDFARIEEIKTVEKVNTPFLTLSRSAIRRNADELVRALPGVSIHYAVKANSHPVILEEISRAGHSFDIASYRELLLTMEAGGTAADVIHSHPIKPQNEIEDAVRAGVVTFVVDNPFEVEKFAQYAGRVRLLIRIKTDGSKAVVNLSLKFGCLPKEVLTIAEKIRSYGLEYHGLAFHCGSQCLENAPYIESIKASRALIDKLRENGFETRLLDIGGGFPVPYLESVPTIKEFCRPIGKSLQENIDPGIEIACEPGRFISATAITLVSSVIGKSVRSGRNWYFLDDGLYGSFSGRLYDHCRYQVITNRNTTWKASVLAGPTCDSFDIIYKDAILPPLEIGDMLLFPAMGAYCSVSASTFNSLGKAEYVVIE